MPDVSIIYAREDETVASKVHSLLFCQWDIWWDDKIVGGFASKIKESIAQSKCVVAIFSRHAEKPTVTDELRIATKAGCEIIPLQLDDSDPPYSYGHLSRIDFRDWDGTVDHPKLQQLLRKLGSVVAPRQAPSRFFEISKPNLPIPSIFMSVSSHETQFDPPEALRALKAHSTSSILVSAYDLARSEHSEDMISEISEYRKMGGLVLIDSGNYEAYRLEDKTWKHQEFKRALARTPHDWAFSFDKMNPSPSIGKAIDEIVKAVERDSKCTSAPILPIIHVSQNEEGLARLPKIVKGISERLHPQIIAIPERELGAGLTVRAKTMTRIRQALSELPYYQPIHLLGTGNPWSIAVLVSAGADTFDGLEWCRFVIDPVTNRLHHFQHFDLFKGKAERTDFLDAVDQEKGIRYAGIAAFYNLEYYEQFGRMMRSMISKNEAELFAIGVMNGVSLKDLRKLFPETFN